jgi:hypothetical protein
MVHIMSKRFFEAYAKHIGIPLNLANKIVDGRYKPYLSAIDDQYYEGNTVYDAKVEALQAAMSSFGREQTIMKLKRLR